MRHTDRRTRPAPARRGAIVLALAALLLAACSSDKASTASTVAPQSTPITTTTAPSTTTPPIAATSTSSTTSAPTTTTTPTSTTVVATTTAAPTPAQFAEPGPYPVGVTTVTLPKGPTVEVWYPAAADGATGYDVRDFVPPGIRAALTGDVPATFTYPGQRDAAIADGRYPLVVFSHGFSGFRTQSSFLTAHLASWGMIVAAPEHASRDLANVLAGTASGDQADAVDDVLRTIDLLVADDVADSAANADAAADGSPSFAGHVDTERIGLVGHSAGGFTAATAAAADGRVDGYVSMASGGVAAGTPAANVPSLFLAGATDAVVPADNVSRPAFDAAPAPASFVEIDATGHNGFDDLCTLGGGRGIIGVAEASGLGPALDSMPGLRTLGLDGCIAPAAPVEQAFPIIRAATTSFLRFTFGEDAAASLGPELADGQALGVSTAAR